MEERAFIARISAQQMKRNATIVVWSVISTSGDSANLSRNLKRRRGLQIIKMKHIQLMQCKIQGEGPWGATAKGQSGKLGSMAFLVYFYVE